MTHWWEASALTTTPSLLPRSVGYFFFCLNNLSASMSTINTDYPRVICLFGYFQVSYASADFDLRLADGPYIYKGFMMKGRVNILGWEIFAHVKLSDAVRATVSGNCTECLHMKYRQPYWYPKTTLLCGAFLSKHFTLFAWLPASWMKTLYKSRNQSSFWAEWSELYAALFPCSSTKTFHGTL